LTKQDVRLWFPRNRIVDFIEGIEEIFSAGALEDYFVSSTRHGVLLEELWWWEDEYHPSLKFEIKCSRGSCALNKGSCLLKRPVNPYPQILNEIKKRSRDKDQSGAPYLDAMMIKAFAQALGGDQKAQEFFLEKNRPLWLDGSIGEEWIAAQMKLEKAKKLGCLQ